MKLKRLSLLTMILPLLSGCSFTTDRFETATSIPVPSETWVASLATLPLPSETATVTQIPSPISPTLTPFSKLTSEESVRELFELLENNGDCQLPCLLGYTPGVSTREEMKNFFSQFVSVDSSEIVIDKVRDDDGKWNAVGFYFRHLDVYFDIGLTSYEDATLSTAFALDSASRHKWHPSYRDTMNYFMLPNILANYGAPSQVSILTYRNDPQRPDITAWPFFLFVLYQDQGFYILYEMNRVSTGVEFRGCPAESFVSIATWSPGDNETFNMLTDATVLGNYLSDYKSISDSTSMDLDDFYQEFSNPDNTTCVDTPIDVWLNP